MLRLLCLLALLGAPALAQEAPPAARVPDAPTPDDRYRFTGGQERSVPLERTPAGVAFLWPQAPAWDTAFLGVKSWGAEAEPWVEINGVRNYLDPQALGLRWLNLTALRGLTPGTRVEIKTHAITLAPTQATLRLFHNRLDLEGPILVLAPHPDDAELAAFGLYSGRDATIVTVTSGNAGDFNYRAQVSDPAEHYRWKGWLRAVDSVTVPWQGRIPPEKCFNLGYFDARLAAMRKAPDTAVAEMYGPNTDVAPYRAANLGRLLPVGSRTNTWNHLVEDLAAILRKVRPSLVVMPHPLLDSHGDHKHTTVAAVQAMEAAGVAPTCLLYTNHVNRDRYPYGPSGTSAPLPPWSSSDILVESVYAHPVTPQVQLGKLFALESMHDLRLAPDEQRSVGSALPGRRPDYPRVEIIDYLRRAPRSEELFFVASAQGARDVVNTYLASLK